MASDLSGLDLLVIQIEGIHMDEDLILVAAIGVGQTSYAIAVVYSLPHLLARNWWFCCAHLRPS